VYDRSAKPENAPASRERSLFLLTPSNRRGTFRATAYGLGKRRQSGGEMPRRRLVGIWRCTTCRCSGAIFPTELPPVYWVRAQVFPQVPSGYFIRTRFRRKCSAMSRRYPSLHLQVQKLHSIAPQFWQSSNSRRYSAATRPEPAHSVSEISEANPLHCLRNAIDGHSASSVHAGRVHPLYRRNPAKLYRH
jgi:hypothetical protein